MMRLLRTRLKSALTTWPDRRGWRGAGLSMLGFVALALPIGLASGVLRPGWSEGPVGTLLAFCAIALLFPGLFEELVFRVLLLPHPDEAVSRRRMVFWAIASLALFIGSHPLNAWLWRVSARPVFNEPAFLAIAGLLGLACTLAYWRSRSIWPPVLMHWLTVVLWRVCLGGKLM